MKISLWLTSCYFTGVQGNRPATGTLYEGGHHLLALWNKYKCIRENSRDILDFSHWPWYMCWVLERLFIWDRGSNIVDKQVWLCLGGGIGPYRLPGSTSRRCSVGWCEHHERGARWRWKCCCCHLGPTPRTRWCFNDSYSGRS
jgi:hypothetical protein